MKFVPMTKPKPLNLNMYGVDLSWVISSTNLGNELSEDCYMEQDLRCKRADVIDKLTGVKETFSFPY